MCSYCEKTSCPSSCPSFDGYIPGVGEPIATCGICGKEIYRGDRFIDNENCPICSACASDMELDELVMLSGADDFWEVLSLLGINVSDGR